jgi:hypothetical protein
MDLPFILPDNIPNFRCKDCKKLFMYELDYISHLKYRCEHCFYNSCSERKMHTHIKKIDIKNCYTLTSNNSDCFLCKRKFKCHKKRFEHEDIKHKINGKYKCNICDKNFINRKSFKEHISSHRKIKPYQCNTCKYNTAQYSNLKSHIINIHHKIIRNF